MAAAETLKSIQYFYETILHKATCSFDWNEEGICNAFIWADFCEQIHKKYADGPIGKELDKLIHNLTMKTGTSWCFDNLKYCSSQLGQTKTFENLAWSFDEENQIKQLAFLQNPMIEKSFFENIVLKVSPAPFNLEEVKNDADSLENLCSELVESLQPIAIVNSERSLYYEVKAELFLKFLKEVSLQLANEEQSETQLSLAFETLCQSPEKMMVIIHVLMYDPQDKSNEFLEIQNFAVNWILLTLLEDPNGSLAHFLWNLPPTTLIRIALKYAPFHSFYLDHLTRAAQSLRLEYQNYGKKWKKSRISTSEVTLSYEEVVNHFRLLITLNDDVSKATEGHLRSLMSTRAESSIWQDIWTSLHSS